MSDRVRDAIEAIAEARAQREQRPPSLFDELISTTVEVTSAVGTPTAGLPEAEAIRSVERNAGRAWSDYVLAIIERVAASHPTLTVDSLAPLITEPVHDARALGPVMRRAAKAGIIASTGEFEISNRPESHSRPVRVWRSCLYESTCAS